MVTTRYERVHLAGHALHLPEQVRTSLEIEARLKAAYKGEDVTPTIAERLGQDAARETDGADAGAAR